MSAISQVEEAMLTVFVLKCAWMLSDKLHILKGSLVINDTSVVSSYRWLAWDFYHLVKLHHLNDLPTTL